MSPPEKCASDVQFRCLSYTNRQLPQVAEVPLRYQRRMGSATICSFQKERNSKAVLKASAQLSGAPPETLFGHLEAQGGRERELRTRDYQSSVSLEMNSCGLPKILALQKFLSLAALVGQLSAPPDGKTTPPALLSFG